MVERTLEKGVQIVTPHGRKTVVILLFDRLKSAASHAIMNGSGQGGFLSWL
jgi:hypothetical protein